jgi:hypothetical protein
VNKRQLKNDDFKKIENAIKYEIGKEYILIDENKQDKEKIAFHYELIAKTSADLFEKINIPVIFTENDEYKSAFEMRARVEKENKIYIFCGGSKHPFLTQKQNNTGRAVHDIYAHLICGCPFSFSGEFNAYLTQRLFYPVETWKTLYAEIPGQTAAFYYMDGFNFQQKAIEAPPEWIEKTMILKTEYENKKYKYFDDIKTV